MSHLLTGPELAKVALDSTPWLLKPYLPKEGIVFLYGKKGVGKSPVTWALARSVASGEPFLGHSVERVGRVLYIEVDSPLALVAGRMQGQTPLPEQVYFYFPSNPILISRDGLQQVKRDLEDVPSELVIINTLRKIHVLKDTDSATVSYVYAHLKALFPDRCLLLVHHEKKTPANPDYSFEKGEEFSGSLAWHNDANVCLHLHRERGVHPPNGINLVLENTGNQGHAFADPLPFLLADNGFTIQPRNPRTPSHRPQKPS